MRLLLLFLLVFNLSYGGAKVQEWVLPNGLTLLLKETQGKGIVGGYVLIRSGVHGEKKRGLTNLMAVLLTKGSKNFSPYEVASSFEDYGGSISASSTDDFVEIGFATKVEGLKKALEVIKDLLENPLFDEEALQREKINAISTIRARKERAFELAMDNLRKLTYKGTPYEYPPIGIEEDIQSITREDLVVRWYEILKGKNTVVALVGDFKAEDVRPMLEETFSSIPSGEYVIQRWTMELGEDKVEHVKRPGEQATILCAFSAPEITSKDYFAFRVLNSVMGDGMTSKLFKELREEKGYAYATYSMYPSRLFSPRLFAYIGTSPIKGEDALRDMIKVIKESDINQEDVEIAKSKIVGSYLLDQDTRIRQAWYLAFFQTMGLGWKTFEEFPDRIQEVRLEDVRRVRNHIQKHHCVVVQP